MFFSLLFWWENSFLVVCPMCSPRTRGDVDARHLDGAVQPDGVRSSVQDGFQLIQGSRVWEVQLHRNQVFVENQRSYKDRKPKQHTTAEDSSEKWQEQHRPGSCCMFYLLVTDMSRNLWGKKTKQTFFLGTSCEGKKSLLLNNEISISVMEWNSLWRCTDWQSCPSVGKPLMHPHVFVSLSHLLYVTHLSHGHEWPSSHRHWTVPPSDLQT